MKMDYKQLAVFLLVFYIAMWIGRGNGGRLVEKGDFYSLIWIFFLYAYMITMPKIPAMSWVCLVGKTIRIIIMYA